MKVYYVPTRHRRYAATASTIDVVCSAIGLLSDNYASCLHKPVMLVLGLGLGLRGLALAKNSRPKSWRTTMFTMNFHRLE